MEAVPTGRGGWGMLRGPRPQTLAVEAATNVIVRKDTYAGVKRSAVGMGLVAG